MAVQTTVDIPELLHDLLQNEAEQSGMSIGSLIVDAIQQVYGKQVYGESDKGEFVTGPLVNGPGQLGSAFPVDENPHEHVFS